MPPLPNNLQQAFKNTEKVLAGLNRAFDNRVFEMVQRIDVFIVKEFAKLPVSNTGALISTEANIRKALVARTNIINFANAEVAGLSEGWAAGFESVGTFVTENLSSIGITSAFTEIDAQIINVLKESVITDFGSGTNFVFQNMGNDLLSQMLVEGDFNALVTRIKGQLSEGLLASGEQLIGGRALAAQARRIGHDSLMNTYSLLNQKKARDAGITKYMYVGPSDDVTREFCLDRVDQVWTTAEIESWNGLQWRGKIPGVDVFVTRGGYNCRHHFQAIPEGINTEDL